MNTHRTEYLDLLESTLCFELWSEPLKPIWATAKRGMAVSALKTADKMLRKAGVALAIVPTSTAAAGDMWPACAHTMVGKGRLRNIRDLCNIVDSEGIPGDWVECGVWRGGASIYARACLDPSRRVVCCDSFQGLPFDPSEPEYSTFDFLRVSESEVQMNFMRFGQWHNVALIKGFFSETLPTLPVEQISILRCDGDMYSSTMQILGPLYPRVAKGGFVIIDDWCLEPCRRAVEHYRELNHITDPIHDIDGIGVCWRKS